MSDGNDGAASGGDAQHNIEMAYASLAVFADDGTLDMKELDVLLGMALDDGEISEAERRILNNVFNRIQEEDVSPDVWQRVQSVRMQHKV
jgi:hypothetical protein